MPFLRSRLAISLSLLALVASMPVSAQNSFWSSEPSPEEIAAKQRSEQQMAQLRQMLLEQDNNYKNLMRELQNTRGENEVLKHEVAQLKKQQQDFYLDIDQRIRKLQSAPTGTASTPATDFSGTAPATPVDFSEGTPTPSPAATAPTTAKPAIAPVTSVTPPVSTAKPVTPPVTVPAAPAMPATTPPPAFPAATPSNAATSAEDVLFQNAFRQLQAGQYDTAIQAFNQQLSQFPQGTQADSAQYWIGEALYALHQYENALTAFNAVLQRYPSSNKRALALLKIGYIYHEMRDYVSAREILGQVINSFPNTSTARLAEERLRKIRAEGF